MDLEKLSNKINFAKAELDNRIDFMVDKEIKLEKDRVYYYKCNGSGYYFIFKKIYKEHTIGEIVTKGGKLKSDIFRLHWCHANQLRAK